MNAHELIAQISTLRTRLSKATPTAWHGTLSELDKLKRSYSQQLSILYLDTLRGDKGNLNARQAYRDMLQADIQVRQAIAYIHKDLINCTDVKLDDYPADLGLLKHLLAMSRFESSASLELFAQELALIERYARDRSTYASDASSAWALYRELIEVRRARAVEANQQDFQALSSAADQRNYLPDLSQFPDIAADHVRAYLLKNRISSGKKSQLTSELSLAKLSAAIHPRFYETYKDMHDLGAFRIQHTQTKIRAEHFFLASDKRSMVLVNPTVCSADTLAHELGHALHWLLSSEQLYFELSEPVADFAEMVAMFFELVACHLIDSKEVSFGDKIVERLETLVWGFELYEFERLVYSEMSEDPSALWEYTHKRYGFESGPDHVGLLPKLFISPFYYSRYALGALAAWQLFRTWRDSKSEEMSQLYDVMKLGRSVPINEILSTLGINIFHTEKAVSAIEEMKYELESK